MADGSGQLGYLGVTRSLSGRWWRERPADPELVRRHQLSLGLSEPLARALAARGIGADAGETYLNPTLKAQFPDPSSFQDMDLAAQILVDALVRDRPVTVFADYDVDGASSAAQLVRWFRAMGKELPIYIPDRVTEGYGPSPAAFRRLRAEGAELVVTMDCGAAAHDAIACAAEIGLDVVVIDHHLMRGDIPKVAALVNPNRPDCASGQGVLAAAGVTFVLLAALNREARSRGLFAERAEPDIRQWLDLAAMGGICDVTQLVGFNRALAAQGLKVMSAWRNPGLKALLEVAKSQGPASTFHAGFILGPRINAGGRIGRSDLGARLLSTDDPEEARLLAEELDALNASRKEVEREVLEAAIRIVEKESNQADAPMLLVAADDWHPGVIGIVAGRLRERYRKPVVIVGIDRAANVGKGSGRSQPGVNLGRAVQGAYEDGLLLAG
ncbi:MAG TPA: single-stranded-DNA-specific exonuclease RecJ, partial [Phenylobacterium sp.]